MVDLEMNALAQMASEHGAVVVEIVAVVAVVGVVVVGIRIRIRVRIHIWAGRDG